MVRACAAEEDCEGIVNFALAIAGVEAAVFLRELPERRIRLSLRSKGRVNVAALAERLGGGGHENAAGCTLDGPLSHALNEILAQLRLCVASLPPRRTDAPIEFPSESVSLNPVDAQHDPRVSVKRGP
jgi:phosphoesterase RecJ-like protein